MRRDRPAGPARAIRTPLPSPAALGCITMDDRIISFPLRPSRVEENAPVKAAPDAVRAGKLRAALKSRDARRRFGGLDQETAARNLHVLLEEYQRTQGVRKVEVRRAGFGDEERTDSTKRLYTHTFPEGAGQERRQRLAKKPDEYFKYAKALAECASADEDSILCRIFLGCSFGTDEALEFDREDERWEQLVRLLKRCVEDVASATGFHTCWREICALPGSYDVRRGSNSLRVRRPASSSDSLGGGRHRQRRGATAAFCPVGAVPSGAPGFR